MSEARVRIADIAEELGLSTATVSNVIHGKTKKVSDETVKRVQELVEKRNYVPNMAGILLAQNNSRIIGIIINDHPKYEGHTLEDGFVAASINALSTQLNECGYFMMIKTTTEWKEITKIASMWNMDGLILIGFCEQDYKKLRENMHIPFVVYDGFFGEKSGLVNISIDDYDGGFQVGKYLGEMGHKKVLCISDNAICMDLERMRGCENALKEFGVKVDCIQVPMESEARFAFYEGKFDQLKKYTAVFAVSDYYGADYVRFMQKKGCNIPKDVSVVGFDDNIYSTACLPALTTVRQDPVMRAKKAVEALCALRDGIATESHPVLPVELVLRDSVSRLEESEG
ncbi:MAG: LacI family DNA-binding transcriptional regulator [bacterium]|nr:LacI family DNA-binding transcriptional regulator [bacterium]